ncbi:MAG: phage tail tape measure protein [Oscillospiraceae bacterium]
MAKSKTYELMLKIGGKADSSLKNACMTADKNLSTLGTSAKKITAAAATAAAAIGTGVVAAAAGLYKVGTAFDGAYDAIRIGTGATGKSLDALKGSMKAVYTAVPAGMDSAAAAIADYNTLLGVTGGTLETLSKDALQVADLLGEDLSGVVSNSSKAFQQWSVAQDKMGGSMDYVFKVSQATGAGFTELMTNMQVYGPQLQEMGYGFENGAALIGQLSREGVNVTEVLGAMKKSVTTLARDGISATDGMTKYCDAIKNAGTATEATKIASEVFGARAASTMTAAIRSGALAADDLTASLTASTETIATAAADTYDFAEKWDIFKHRMGVKIEPAAAAMFDKLGETFDRIAPQLEAMGPMIEKTAVAAADGIGNVVETIIKCAKWTAKNKDMILAVAAGVTTAVVAYKAYKLALAGYNAAMGIYKIVTAASATGTFTLAGAMSALHLKSMLVMGAIGLLVAGGVWLYQNWDMVKAKAAELGAKIGEIWANISTAVSGAIAEISAHFPILGAYLQGFWSSIQEAWGNVQAIFSNIIGFIDNVFAGNWAAAWDNIVAIFGNVFGLIVNLAKAPINGVISAINWVLGKINSVSFNLPDWSILGEWAGATIGFQIPTIPALATGGVATAATLAMVGEGSEPEAILPLSKLAALMELWGKKPKPNGGNNAPDGGIVFAPVLHFAGPADKTVVEAAMQTSFEEFKRMYRQLKAEERRKSFHPA